MAGNCGCNPPDFVILPCSGGTCAGRLACKRPVQKKVDSPRPLSPWDRARSRQLGANAADLSLP